ncbi:unnamed protein product, partial [Prorocentrum cordatum]
SSYYHQTLPNTSALVQDVDGSHGPFSRWRGAEAGALRIPGQGDCERVEEVEVDQDKNMNMESTLKVMMKDMKEMKGMMRKSVMIFQEARDEARSANQAALAAKMTVSSIEEDVKSMKGEMVAQEDMKKRAKAIGKVTTEEEVAHMVEEYLLKFGVAPSRHPASAMAAESCPVVTGVLKQYMSGWMRKLVQSLDVYKKDWEGEEFKGIAFVKFASAVGAPMGPKGSERLWCDIEAPVEKRARMVFVVRPLRNQLVEWKFAASPVRVGKDTRALKVKGEPVAKPNVTSKKFDVDWISDDWEKWNDPQQSPQLRAILQSARDRLARSREGMAKG